MNITLQDMLNHNGSPLDFATSRGISLHDLLTWWHSEETQSQIKDLEDLTQTLTRLKAGLHSPAALDRLTTLLDAAANPSPIERRRTATLILRHTKSPRRSSSPSLREGAGGTDRNRTHHLDTAPSSLSQPAPSATAMRPIPLPIPTPLHFSIPLPDPRPSVSSAASLLLSRAGHALSSA